MRPFLRHALNEAGLPMLAPSWLLMQLVAAFVFLLIGAWRSRGPQRPLLLAFVAALPGGLVGAALAGELLVLPRLLRERDLRVLLDVPLVSWGALAGLALTFAAVARRLRQPLPPALDLLAPAMGAVVLFARLGCFLAGCDFGRVTAVPWAVRFPRISPAFEQHLAAHLVLASDGTSLAVHPSQLYEALLGAASVALCLLVERRRPRPGAVFGAFVTVYAAGRLLIELTRGDDGRTFAGPLSLTQWLCLAALLGVAAFLRSGAARLAPE